ncbi:excinuclease ABC subunit UvrC [Horticoccus luteus]|uniref:Excinuclease ABC subunit UvrC n=1 Tax=Horticoccus luteus TaxID=2862869 RepID=A0A8F9XG89_9BACT|nr:excinuclease ABC subunit UvrC [Horticoccus luteus]QYM78907.1 excinuclease ABC subunit UvrC [Horticoccus luteus]
MSEAINLKEKVRQLPDRPGVYLMKDRLGRIIYVGKAKSLKKRVSSYFQPSRAFTLQQPKIRALIDLITDFETIEVKSEPEALLLEGKLIKQWRPRYNTDFTDDKRFLLVRVDLGEELPRFRLTRLKKEDRSRYFGPFAHSGLLRKTLAQMRRQFGILLGDGTPHRLPDGSWQLYDDVRQELYGFPNTVTSEQYRHRVNDACGFLEGKSREWLETLRAEMASAAEKHEFEKAAELRDVVFALERTLAKTRRFERSDPTRPSADEAAMQALGEALALPAPPRTMECFDISHISGTFVVASMVHFAHGRPDKDHYRRFQIKSFIGNDDFRAMEEVVGRRYRRLAEEQRALPDLVVIDGGRGQIGAALKAFVAIGLTPPALIGLAKKHETIIFPDERAPLNLPLSHPGLQLLQRLRDEAHRFANTYNSDLRSKKIRESVLDDFAGIGPARRAALMDHFGSIERLRAARAYEIAEVPGFGGRMAAELHAFLHRAPDPTTDVAAPPSAPLTPPTPPASDLPGEGPAPAAPPPAPPRAAPNA